MAETPVEDKELVGAPEPAAISDVAVVAKNLINLFAEPNTDCEVVSQALFNSRLVITKEENGFVYVTGGDRYSGWADKRHLELSCSAPGAMPQSASSQAAAGPNAGVTATVVSLTAEVYSRPDAQSELVSKLVIATSVTLAGPPEDIEFDAIRRPGDGGTHGWIRKSDLNTKESPTLKAWAGATRDARKIMIEKLGMNVFTHAKRFIGVPYLWGGCSPFGIDCSGLVQVCYKLEGLELLRDANLQYGDKRFHRVEDGKALEHSKFDAGDLLVFGNKKNITHIGIASGDGRFIHASGRSRNFGTYFDLCSDKDWNDKYMGAVRLSADAELAIQLA